jgi:hypothetical protein
MANPPHESRRTTKLAVSSLLSPPEMKRTDSFNSTITNYPSFNSVDSQQSKPAMTAQHATPPMPVYVSPPISPYVKASQDELHTTQESGVCDPQLFVPSESTSTIPANEPLFPREAAAPAEPAVHDIISQHMASKAFAELNSKPTRADYELIASFQRSFTLIPTVYEQYTQNPVGWYRQEKSFASRYPFAGIKKNKAQPKKPTLKNLAPAPSTAPRKQQKVPLPRIERAPRARAKPAAKRTPKQRTQHSFEDGSPPSVSPKPFKEKREDCDFNSVPDFSPPVSTLGNDHKALKAEWKGSPTVLDNDPNRHLLHPAEIQLASTLRLSCATYLTSKRRIFQSRLHALKIGKEEFRRTDAQQACKIDVNKASRLWAVFNRVGWFDPSYFEQYL